MKSFFRAIAISAAAVLAAVGFIFLILVVVLSLPYRCLVWVIVKFTRPDLTSFITGLSGIFMLDSYKKPTLNLLSIKIIHGRLELQQLRSVMKTRLIEKREENGDKPYARLTHCATNFMGYTFWKQDRNFCIDHHVRLYDYEGELKVPDRCNEEDLRRIMGGLLSAPWKESRSPWEFLLIHNYQPEEDVNPEVEKTAMVCRFHHGIGDGHSSSKLLTDMGLEYKPVAKPTLAARRATWTQSVLTLIYPFKFFYDLADNFMTSLDQDSAWHPTGVKLSKTYYTSFTKPIEVDYVKDIKNKHGVSYIAVLFAAVGGGIQRIMADAGQKTPKKMACFNPIPKKDHPGGMVNHMMWVYTKLPIQADSRQHRLHKIQRNLNKSKTSLAPVTTDLMTTLFGLLPTKLRRIVCCLIRGTLMASNFPVPPDPPVFEGLLVPDVIFGCGTWEVQCGANIFMIGLAGKQRIVVNVDRKAFPSEKIFRKLGTYIKEELDELGKDVVTSIDEIV